MANLSRAQRENVKRRSAAGHARLAFNRKHGCAPKIPSEVIRVLGNLGLPLNKEVYNQHLSTLMPSTR
jgi:hypothetical protein